VNQITFEIAREDADLLEQWCWAQNCQAVSYPANEAAKSWSLSAIFAQHDGETIQSLILETAPDLAPRIMQITTAALALDWTAKWREHFQSFQVGGFRIIPEWETAPETGNCLRIYPGQAFGTGQHATTQLAIRAMERVDLGGKAVLDIGCGTGILAIIAEKLGASPVLGFDIDPACEANMMRHLRINDCQAVQLHIGQWHDFQFPAQDLILANLTLNLLEDIWPLVPSKMSSRSVLLSTGLLEDQREPAIHRLDRAGLQVLDIAQQDEWILIRSALK